MNASAFLNKLRKERKLRLGEPSTALAEAYFRKAANSLRAARLLVEGGVFEDSVSCSYYSMYHAVAALLLRCGIRCENHTASRMLLDQLFTEHRLATVLERAKEERIKKQYYANVPLSRQEAVRLADTAEEFLAALQLRVNRLRAEEIPGIRDQMELL